MKKKPSSPSCSSWLNQPDIGFKVFKLSSSNIKPWDADFDTLENALLSSVDNIKEGRSEDDVVKTNAIQILKKHGVDFRDAVYVFADPFQLNIPDDDHSDAEDREINTMKSMKNTKFFSSFPSCASW